MKVIAIMGGGGGVGVTTVTAQLAMGLASQARRAIAIDACADNALRLHFGMAWADDSGLSTQVLNGLPWNEASYRGAGGVDFIPFGRYQRRALGNDFDQWLDERPGWFAQRLAEIDVPGDAFVICDCPRNDGVFRSQVLQATDLALIVLAPDALSYASALEARQDAIVAGAKATLFLLNKFDPTRMLDRDIVTLMRTDFDDKLLPLVIHRDESLREALANRQTVFEYAPSSQACSNFASLSMWISAWFSGKKSA